MTFLTQAELFRNLSFIVYTVYRIYSIPINIFLEKIIAGNLIETKGVKRQNHQKFLLNRPPISHGIYQRWLSRSSSSKTQANPFELDWLSSA